MSAYGQASGSSLVKPPSVEDKDPFGIHGRSIVVSQGPGASDWSLVCPGSEPNRIENLVASEEYDFNFLSDLVIHHSAAKTMDGDLAILPNASMEYFNPQLQQARSFEYQLIQATILCCNCGVGIPPNPAVYPYRPF
jgi:hypothetical protein